MSKFSKVPSPVECECVFLSIVLITRNHERMPSAVTMYKIQRVIAVTSLLRIFFTLLTVHWTILMLCNGRDKMGSFHYNRDVDM